jgi:hypothetical protein
LTHNQDAIFRCFDGNISFGTSFANITIPFTSGDGMSLTTTKLLVISLLFIGLFTGITAYIKNHERVVEKNVELGFKNAKLKEIADNAELLAKIKICKSILTKKEKIIIYEVSLSEDIAFKKSYNRFFRDKVVGQYSMNCTLYFGVDFTDFEPHACLSGNTLVVNCPQPKLLSTADTSPLLNYWIRSPRKSTGPKVDNDVQELCNKHRDLTAQAYLESQGFKTDIKKSLEVFFLDLLNQANNAPSVECVEIIFTPFSLT